MSTQRFRLVGLCNEATEECHLYLTNLTRYDYRAPVIAQLYRARWEVELLFKERKSGFGLNEIRMIDAYVMEALIIMAGIQLLRSRVVVDELRTLKANQREPEAAGEADELASRPPYRCCSLAIERHAHLIQLYLMIELGCELLDSDEPLLWASRYSNPNKERSRAQIESGEFAFDRP